VTKINVQTNTVTAPLVIDDDGTPGCALFWASEVEGEVRISFVVPATCEMCDTPATCADCIRDDIEELLAEIEIDASSAVTIESWNISIDMQAGTAIASPDGVDVDTRDLPRPTFGRMRR
jgi:hypothetical protein